MVSVLPKKRIKGLIKSNPNTIINIPTKIDKKKLVDAKIRADSISCPPSFREILEPAP